MKKIILALLVLPALISAADPKEEHKHKDC